MPVLNTDKIYIGSDRYVLQATSRSKLVPITNYSNAFSGTNIEYADLSVLKYLTEPILMFPLTFARCQYLKTVIFDIMTSAIGTVYGMFSQCTSLENLNLYGFNTSICDNFGEMCKLCTNLKEISFGPNFTLAQVTQGMYIADIFTGCTNLSQESINNILQVVITASSSLDSSYKTAAHIGLSSSYKETIETSPYYQAFLNAGWTLGF